MATLNRNTARLIVMSVCVAIITLLSISDAWPLWAQGAVAVVLIVALPLLNSLGVLEALSPRLKNIPGSRWNPRYMFSALALVLGAFVWFWVLYRLVPHSNLAVLLFVVPAVVAGVAAVLLFIKAITK